MKMVSKKHPLLDDCSRFYLNMDENYMSINKRDDVIYNRINNIQYWMIPLINFWMTFSSDPNTTTAQESQSKTSEQLKNKQRDLN